MARPAGPRQSVAVVALKVLLFGRFEVLRAGRPVEDWGGRKARELVKMLAAAGGQAVGRDRLAEWLWDELPAQPERDLKVLVSRARRALGDDAHDLIVTTEHGYALAVASSRCWLDTAEMERLVRQGALWEHAGRPALAEASYQAAIELYRGPLLAEDLYADWVAPHRERYQRLYLTAQLALGALLFVHGDPRALQVAARLHEEDPYSDTAIQALMATRARFGDSAAALGVYARFRRRLLADLGASPSPETESLHAAILRGELGSWPGSGSALPNRPGAVAPEGPLVGRERELAELADALEAAAEGRPGLVIVAGEPGVGKSRLLRALRDRAAGRFSVLEATGSAQERYLPFQLLAEAIRSLDVGADELRRAVGGYGDALAEAVPDLVGLTDRPARQAISQIARRRTFEGFLHLVRALAEARPVLVILDDFHWADPSTVDAVRFCLRRLQASRVLVAVAVRSGEPEDRAEELADLVVARRIDLAPLRPDAVRLLIGSVSEETARRIVAESGGIPFYVVELARALAESGDAEVPSGVRKAIQQRVSRVAPRGRRFLESAAVLGDAFRLEEVAALTDLPLGVALEAAEDLVRRRLMLDDGARSPGLRFAHELVRRSVYDAIGPTRRRLLHGRAADLALGGSLAGVARHARVAGRPARAADLFRDAGDAALARLATREAEQLFGEALSAARNAALSSPIIAEYLDRLGRARAAHGDHEGAAEAHRAALALSTDEVAAARQKVRLAWLAYYEHQLEGAVELAWDASTCRDGAMRGEGLLLQAKVAHALGRVEEAAARVAEASRAVGPEAVGEVRALEVALANHRARFGEAVLELGSTVERLRQAGLFRPLATLMLHGGIALAGRGDYVRGLAILEESWALCRQAGATHLESRVPNTLGSLYRELGQPTRAAELHSRSVELAQQAGFGESLAHSWIGLAEIALDSGDIPAAKRHLERARPLLHDPTVLHSWRIRLRWELVGGRVALLEGDATAAQVAAQTVLVRAAESDSPKYQVLAHLLEAQALGPSAESLAPLRKALLLAQRLQAPGLVARSALAYGQRLVGLEGASYLKLARETAEGLARPLPDDLARCFLGSLGLDR